MVPRLGIRRWLAAVLAVVMAAPVLATGEEGEALRELDSDLFPVPSELAANVEFWTMVYSKYDSHHVLLHDERQLDVVYAVVDFTELDASEISAARKMVLRRQNLKDVSSKYKTLLTELASGRVSKAFPDDQERVRKLFEGVPGDRGKFADAAGRIRTQTCLADRFAEGVARAGRYLPAFEKIFVDRDLPRELTRLPFVESLFVTHAHSSAAAVGVWQFVRGTARGKLAMELEYDERRDPWRSTEAAAELLAQNYADLGSWPLAITAYNHGTNGMKRAVRTLGTSDLGKITGQYKSRLFGFASRNFYAEFIAAATLYENRDRYYPDVVSDSPWTFDEMVPDRYVSIGELARQTSSSLDVLKDLNPALTSEVWSDHLYVPLGYRLRVPAGQAETFQTAYGVLGDDAKSAHQVGLYYKVRSGDTLGTIAAKFGTTIGELQRANSIANPHLIRQGQSLLIPPKRGAARVASAATGGGTTHVVRRGETLASIARRYGTTVAALMAVNRISGHLILPAQVLVIP